MKAIYAVLLLALAMMSSSAPAQSSADAIYFHGNILTGVDLESPHPQRVTAIAVAHGEIVAAGSDQEILARYKNGATHLVDLKGAF
ncbi:MAG: amidohydrolase, partial [Acidobacteriaceae bacterium]